MLANNYEDIECPNFPMLISPKLDGIRAGWFPGEGLFTRQGKLIAPKILPHIYKQLQGCQFALDCELYCHGMSFQKIAGLCAVARDAAGVEAHKIDAHVFDLIESGINQTARLVVVKTLHKSGVILQMVESKVVYSNSIALSCHTENLKKGYEGSMLRDLYAHYTPGRSDMLLKLKPWKQFKAGVLGFTEGKGKYIGSLGALICAAEINGVSVGFKVSGGLTDAQRNEIWKNRQSWTGRIISCRAQEFSDDNVPLKPQIVSL